MCIRDRFIMSKIKIIEPGFFSTIQDQGRIGHRHKGIPLSGPMDTFGFKFAHQLVNNDYSMSLIESTLKGPKLLVEGKIKLVYSGALMDVYLNKKKVMINKPFECNSGDIVSFGHCLSGVRLVFFIYVCADFLRQHACVYLFMLFVSVCLSIPSSLHVSLVCTFVVGAIGLC